MNSLEENNMFYSSLIFPKDWHEMPNKSLLDARKRIWDLGLSKAFWGNWQETNLGEVKFIRYFC